MKTLLLILSLGIAVTLSHGVQAQSTVKPKAKTKGSLTAAELEKVKAAKKQFERGENAPPPSPEMLNKMQSSEKR